ncbi:conserved hypothetical protein [Culex quinquefasciatus]|uniref:SAP domain-containing protein n=1 Tax=Culex quinquefasciatus TaxID=7176 RepID=B0X1B2_CULQU|nr:conserved hypothetical protein [Culex quinquefasciatus]|eukprot:XP_001863434.1 conserved hypothetical protein [Culex quinquefasciatus]
MELTTFGLRVQPPPAIPSEQAWFDNNQELLDMDSLTDKFEMECDSQISRTSPPKAVIDSSPLQTAMDKNKESLKVKLLVRRSLNQLVEQGIMPSPKTSPAIYEQTRQLERAKTGDMLKAKIKQRPDRMELERRHILEHQEGNIDPSLAEKKRMLEKALLVDHLNSKISHRPGPLELIEKNILHADEPIERIVKEGLVNYTPTDEAVSPGQALLSPESMVCIEDDSLSSEGETQHLHKIQPINVIYLAQPQATITSEVIAAPCITIEPSAVAADLPKECSFFFRALDSVKPESSEKSSVIATETSRKTISSSSIKNDIKEKIKKKSKNKAISKARSIKFHEYKGPPNAQKHSSISVQKSGETNYQLIMKQQSLLEYLEDLCKNPPALPASSKMSFSAKEKDTAQGGESSSLHKLPPDPATEKLNKLKVFQLKRYCKTYNLPVSGSKSSLVDRLKPYLHMMEKIPDFEGKGTSVEALCSSAAHDPKNQDTIEENLLKEQQKRIAELQRQLKKSQEELELIKQNQKKSEQDFLTQTVVPTTSKDDQRSEIMQFKGEEINITPLATDKILSEMDIKITVRIDPDTTSTLLKPKSEPNFGDTEIMAIQPQDGKVDSSINSGAFEAWKANQHLEAIGSASETVPHCNDSFGKMVDDYVSNNETLDKLLGQVQPDIPNICKSVEHSYTNHISTGSCSQNSSMTADLTSNSLENNCLQTPLVLSDYNDVDLLDFPMHIDDTCDTVYSLPKTDNSAFHQAMEVREPECSSNHLKQLNFEAEMHTESNDSENNERSEEKNMFNDFDALVHSEPFCDMFSGGRNVGNPDMTEGKELTKVSHSINDINQNYTPSTAVILSTCLLGAQQRHLENFPDPVACNTVKREWSPSDMYYGSAKYKPTPPPPACIQQSVQLNHNHTELVNMTGDKISNAPATTTATQGK